MRSYIAGFSLFFFIACLLPQSLADGISSAQSSVVASQNILDAEKAGLVDVKYIPNDSRSAQIVIDNKSDQPLTLRLPKAFVGVPVLAQFGGGGIGGGGMGGGGMGGGMDIPMDEEGDAIEEGEEEPLDDAAPEVEGVPPAVAPQ